MPLRLRARRLGLHLAAAWGLLLGAVACADRPGTSEPTAPGDWATTAPQPAPEAPPAGALPPSDGALVIDDAEPLLSLDCTGDTRSGTVRCAGGDGGAAGASLDVAPGVTTERFGGQNTFVKLTGSAPTYVGTTYEIDVTVQNLMNEAIGTPDGTVVDPAGVRVFFSQMPVATGGSGTITIANADGTLGTGEPYFQYDGILAKDAVSPAKRWRFTVPNTVTTFSFRVLLATSVQPLLVINEVMVNPAGSTIETTGDWFEVYNAGTRAVNMQNFVIADSAASGRRPYHLVNASLVVPSGGYVTFGGASLPSANGGATIDYSYGGSLALASSLDAVKIARTFGTVTPDTLTIDRVQYSQASVSAIDGVSRELKNPALDNANMDGSNWVAASVTAVYGAGGRGTPKAQNSGFTPMLVGLGGGTGGGPPERGRPGGPARLGRR